MKNETHYGWRIWCPDEPGAPFPSPIGGHYIFPRSDPHVDEQPVDFMYDTIDDAIEALKDQEWLEEAIVNKWVLVQVTEAPVELDLLALRIPQLHIHYEHHNCPRQSFQLSTVWVDTWSSAVDADCPACGARDISPDRWHDISDPCPPEEPIPNAQDLYVVNPLGTLDGDFK